MRKLGFLTLVLALGTALVAFTPKQSHQITYNDVTQTVETLEIEILASQFTEFETFRYTANRTIWNTRYRTWNDPIGRSDISVIEEVITKH